MLKKLNLKSKTFAENLIKYVLVARFFALSIPYRVYKKLIDLDLSVWERDKIEFFLKLYEFTFFFNEKYDKLIKIYGDDIKDLREINDMMSKFFKVYLRKNKFMSKDGVTLIQHPAVKRVYHKALREAKKFLRDEDESVIDVTRQILNVYLRTPFKAKITKEFLAKIKIGNKNKDQLNELLSTKVKYWALSIGEYKLSSKYDENHSVHSNLFYIMSIIWTFAETDLEGILYTGNVPRKELDKLIEKVESPMWNYCLSSLTERIFGQLKSFGYSYKNELSGYSKKNNEYVKIERHLDDEDFEYDVDEDEEDQDYEDDDSDYEEDEESDEEYDDEEESEDEEDSEDEDSDYEDDEDDSDYEDDEDDSDDNESVESLANKIQKSAFAKRLLKLACIKKFVAANHIAQPKYLILMISIMFSAFLYQQQHNGENGYTDKMLKTLDECAPKIAKRPTKSVIEKVFKFFAENLNDIIISMKDSI